MRLIFLKLDVDLSGNTKKPGDVSRCHWKSYLFFLTYYGHELDYPEISAVRMAEQLTLRAVSCASDDP
jgi:hypothetical protein